MHFKSFSATTLSIKTNNPAGTLFIAIFIEDIMTLQMNGIGN